MLTEKQLGFFKHIWKSTPLVAIMGFFLWVQDARLESYKTENNSRVEKLENMLSACNEGRINDLKLIHGEKESPIRITEPTYAVIPDKQGLIVNND